jgi:hypothetical protein
VLPETTAELTERLTNVTADMTTAPTHADGPIMLLHQRLHRFGELRRALLDIT